MRYYHLTPEDRAIVGHSTAAYDMADHDRDDLSLMSDLERTPEIFDPATRIALLEEEIAQDLLARGFLPVDGGRLSMGSDYTDRVAILVEEITL